MTIIGITGSIASGKSTVAKLIVKKKYPFFSADKEVLNLYKNKKFIKLLTRKFNLSREKEIKIQIKLIINKNKNELKTLESIIHPLVRKKMINFLKNKKKLVILEIPLLIENKLNKYFDKIIFIDAKKKSNKKMFEVLNKRQLQPDIKKKRCDFIINNNYSLAILRKNVKKIIKNYE